MSASPVDAVSQDMASLKLASDEIYDYLGKDFTADQVPRAVLNAVVMSNDLYVDCLDAGKKVGTNLTLPEARSLGLIKNHWLYRILFAYGDKEDPSVGQVQFGMNMAPEGSLVGIGSSRAGSFGGSGSFKTFSDVGSVGEPPKLSSDDGISAPADLQVASASASEGDRSGSDSGNQPATSSIGSGQFTPPEIASSLGGFIEQPTEGAPVPGIFSIKVRARAAPSNSALVIFRLDLRPDTTFGELLSAIIDLPVEPFRFRFKNFAYLGCRDFMTQTIASLLSLGLVLSPAAETIKPVDKWTDEPNIFDRLQWRYKCPDVVGNMSEARGEGDASEEPVDVAGEVVQPVEVSISRSRNAIDRAWWPEGYTYLVIDGVSYADAPRS
ncbi:hypothetical protein FRB90_002109 [Tulasnella sp. 427]|nr:hypothetical protein FRB90_002109 [Tulasnella sp. 427]